MPCTLRAILEIDSDNPLDLLDNRINRIKMGSINWTKIVNVFVVEKYAILPDKQKGIFKLAIVIDAWVSKMNGVYRISDDTILKIYARENVVHGGHNYIREEGGVPIIENDLLPLNQVAMQ